VSAIKVHGIIKGTILGVLRIVRCNPFSGGGFNPVPSKRKWFADVYPNGSPRG
jgi:putative component of membrane protein insertase Oxa1/YidC/SpoIIIJ protein YidD